LAWRRLQGAVALRLIVEVPPGKLPRIRTPQHIPAVPRAYHSTARTSPPPYLSQNAAVRVHGHGSVSMPRQFDTAAKANAVGGGPSSRPVHQHAVNAPVLTNNFAVSLGTLVVPCQQTSMLY
jgi:hypothetical protein